MWLYLISIHPEACTTCLVNGISGCTVPDVPFPQAEVQRGEEEVERVGAKDCQNEGPTEYSGDQHFGLWGECRHEQKHDKHHEKLERESGEKLILCWPGGNHVHKQRQC